MNSSGPSGFYGAPVTKAAVIVVSGLSVLTSVYRLKPLLYLQLVPHLTVHRQYWRLLTSGVAFSSTGETLFGALLFYHCRVVERQYGSAKYASMLVVTSVLATALEIAALAVARPIGLHYIPSGPYGMVFATLYQLYAGLPCAYRFSLLGGTFSDKSLLYLLGLQLMISHWPGSMAAGLCGILAGVIYRTNLLGMKRWRFPGFIRRFTARLFLPIFGSRPARRSNHTLPEVPPSSIEQRRQYVQPTADTVREYVGAFTAAPAGPDAVPVPDEEQINMLAAMFPHVARERIVSVLMESRNDPNRAVSVLLDGPQ